MQKLLSVTGISISEAVRVLFKRSKSSQARGIPIKQNLPRITSGWDYRPKEATRRFVAVQSVEMEEADLLAPSVAEAESDNVFEYRWLEFGAHAFVSAVYVDSTAPNEPMKPSLSDHERTVPAYD